MNTKRALLLFLLSACSAPTGGGILLTDASLPVSDASRLAPQGTMPTPPVEPSSPAPVDQRPCPSGYTERQFGDAIACAPFTTDERTVCPPGTMQVPGDQECRPIGSLCPTEFVEQEGAYYVSATAGSAGDGSFAAPFRTLAAALAAAPDNAEVIVGPGTYVESVVLRRGVRLRGVCVEQVTVRAPATQNFAVGIADGEVSNVNIAAANGAGVAFVGVGRAHDVQIGGRFAVVGSDGMGVVEDARLTATELVVGTFEHAELAMRRVQVDDTSAQVPNTRHLTLVAADDSILNLERVNILGTGVTDGTAVFAMNTSHVTVRESVVRDYPGEALFAAHHSMVDSTMLWTDKVAWVFSSGGGADLVSHFSTSLNVAWTGLLTGEGSSADLSDAVFIGSTDEAALLEAAQRLGLVRALGVIAINNVGETSVHGLRTSHFSASCFATAGSLTVEDVTAVDPYIPTEVASDGTSSVACQDRAHCELRRSSLSGSTIGIRTNGNADIVIEDTAVQQTTHGLLATSEAVVHRLSIHGATKSGIGVYRIGNDVGHLLGEDIVVDSANWGVIAAAGRAELSRLRIENFADVGIGLIEGSVVSLNDATFDKGTPAVSLTNSAIGSIFVAESEIHLTGGLISGHNSTIALSHGTRAHFLATTIRDTPIGVFFADSEVTTATASLRGITIGRNVQTPLLSTTAMPVPEFALPVF